MNAAAELSRAGQSVWLDNVTRDLLHTGTLQAYIDDLSVTGLTSNPTIYDRAISGSSAYDPDIRQAAGRSVPPEETFFSLALDDLGRAADLFAPVHLRTGGVDGFVSLEVSPLLAYDAVATQSEALRLHRLADRPNLLIKIPGTSRGLLAIEETIFAGVPVNVTLLFSPSQFCACMEAYTRGVERRVEAGLSACVASVASVFVSRWDGVFADRLPPELRNSLGIAIGRQAYVDYRRFFATDRWQRLVNAGARPQRLLFASTGTKDPRSSDVLYVEALAAPHTVDTMPEETLLAFADHGRVGPLLAADPALATAELARFAAAGVDVDAAGEDLQAKGAEAFVRSWSSLLARIKAKSASIAEGSGSSDLL
jgi:transaldolase